MRLAERGGVVHEHVVDDVGGEREVRQLGGLLDQGGEVVELAVGARVRRRRTGGGEWSGVGHGSTLGRAVRTGERGTAIMPQERLTEAGRPMVSGRRPHRVTDIAAQAGLSRATVDRVLHGRAGVRAATVAEVEQAIAELDRQRAQVRLSGRTVPGRPGDAGAGPVRLRRPPCPGVRAARRCGRRSSGPAST